MNDFWLLTNLETYFGGSRWGSRYKDTLFFSFSLFHFYLFVFYKFNYSNYFYKTFCIYNFQVKKKKRAGKIKWQGSVPK